MKTTTWYRTIWYATFTYAQKLTANQLNLPHGTKTENKNKNEKQKVIYSEEWSVNNPLKQSWGRESVVGKICKTGKF